MAQIPLAEKHPDLYETFSRCFAWDGSKESANLAILRGAWIEASADDRAVFLAEIKDAEAQKLWGH